MEHKDAVSLIQMDTGAVAQTWADLGCGSGTFTKALASVLYAGSRIIAVDLDVNSLRAIPSSVGEIEIETVAADFTNYHSSTMLDGIIMANALHYVKEQAAFLKQTVSMMKPSATLILVEYDREQGNQWVPYPLSFAKAGLLLTAAGFSHPRLLGRRPSVFGGGTMYAASADLIQKDS